MLHNRGTIAGNDLVYIRWSNSPILHEERYGVLGGGFVDPESEDVFPIPLTEKILVDRCGFNYSVSDSTVTYKDTPDRTGFFNIVPNPLLRGTWLLCYKDVKIAISALHELQNAFYVLFKKELEIK